MSACPPLARDRLVGLAGVSKSLVQNMEDSAKPRISPRMEKTRLRAELQRISNIIETMADPDIFPWLSDNRSPEEQEITRSSTIVADRLCGTVADPIIRNAQEKRQLAAITALLEKKGYVLSDSGTRYDAMSAGTFSFHVSVPVYVAGTAGERVHVSVDAAIMPLSAREGDMPLFIEAKSAGDFTNVNKRRKEEAVKMQQLRNTFGGGVRYLLFLCGYFDSGYLGYEAAEGIDWIWEHRISDLEQLGI
ncbi:MAG: XamI family restriction endonuclease [Oscillospiraceae bacterium]|nr:XamI family restriction endonuclease [Oscillospiraceae bacterium]